MNRFVILTDELTLIKQKLSQCPWCLAQETPGCRQCENTGYIKVIIMPTLVFICGLVSPPVIFLLLWLVLNLSVGLSFLVALAISWAIRQLLT